MPKKIAIDNASRIDVAVLLNELKGGSPIQLTRNGKAKAVLMTFRHYKATLGKLEDLEDILAAKEVLAAPDSEAITLDEYERQRKSKTRL
jgi:hypothetical protein